MPEPERVPHLVTCHEAYELPHQLVAEVHLACRLVDAARLHEVPVVQELHDVVIPADVAFQYLARPRVGDVRAVSVLRLGGEVADDAVASVLHAHRRVVALGPLEGVDGVLETRLLEGSLPVVDALDKVLAPLLRRCGVDVIDDGLLRLHQLARHHLLHVLGTRLKPPAGDVLGVEADALLLVAVAVEDLGEVAHTQVEEARLHRLFGQQDEADVQRERHTPRHPHRPRVLRAVVGLHEAHLSVCREALDILDVAVVPYHLPKPEALLGALREAERVVVVEEARGIELKPAVLVLLHLERADDGVLVAACHRLAYSVRRVGLVHEEPYAQEQRAVGVKLEVHHVVVHLLAAELAALRWGGDIACGGEQVFAEQGVRHLEEPFVVLLGYVEQPRAVNVRLLLLFLLLLSGSLSGFLLSFLRFLAFRLQGHSHEGEANHKG